MFEAMKKMAVAVLSVALLLPNPVAASAPSTQLLRVFTEPTAGFTPVYSLILSARRSVDMTMYELEDATAERDLAAAAARGVDVRVFLDRAYSGAWANRQAARLLARERCMSNGPRRRSSCTRRRSWSTTRPLSL